ncbi:MAG: hypothetical protein KDD02_01765 [Phaeodactylibacter sp.]|nr:hypothetical protein [Phaeodactylibacter sp.]MCB9304141.1 hypothetical protein [Lewinellaceae bacterium]
MPVISQPTCFRPPVYQFNGHLQTVLPAVLRKVESPYERERITLSDGGGQSHTWSEYRALEFAEG